MHPDGHNHSHDLCRFAREGGQVAFGVTLALLLPHAAHAQGNIVDTADPALPSAHEVIVDLPSARHASRYQSGDISGLRYVLFPDGTGKVMTNAGQRAVVSTLECAGGLSCTITASNGDRTVVVANGGPKPAAPTAVDAAGLSQYLASWILAGRGQPAEEPTEAQNPPPEADIQQPAGETEAVVAKAPEPDQPAPSVPVAAKPSLALPKSSPKPMQVRTRARPVTVPTPAVPRPSPTPTSQTKPAQERETFFQRINLSCSISGRVTLRFPDPATRADTFGKPRVSLGCGARLSEKLSLRFAVIGFADRSSKSDSDAEFTYALNYRATEKLTFSYSNFTGRFSGSGRAFTDSLTEGNLTARYRLPRIELPNDKSIGCSASIGIAKPEDTRAGLSCSYAVTKKLRIGATAFAYLPGAQDRSDPDFSYTANYQINDDWSVNYSNFNNNRFFWNKSSRQDGILNGTVSVSYRFKF